MNPSFSLVRSWRGWLPGVGALLLAGTVQAETPAANNSGKEYVLTHQSSYEPLATGARSPFWPIGWTPSAVISTQTAVVQQLDVKPENFVVTTISVDYPPLAIINAHSYGVGEHVPVPGNGGGEFATVKQILDGVVVLDYRGHEMRSMTKSAVVHTPTK